MLAKSANIGGGWQYFPAAVALWLGLVAVVNGGMVWSALHTFPGTVDDHAFDRSNAYDTVLDNAAKQAALGWQLDVKVQGRRVVLSLVDRDGKPVADLKLSAVASRPVGPAETTRIELSAQDGHLVGSPALPGAGQWDLALDGEGAGHDYHVTRRISAE
jgi:nitrogen fixation protein FixH